MKTFRKQLIASFVMILCLCTACGTDDLKDDIQLLKNRVENLEAFVNKMNGNLSALQVFIEGGKTIQNCEVITGTDGVSSYKLTLSNGEVITLSQGVKGTVQYPEITIDKDGYWVIAGTKQEGCKAIGDNGMTPKFRVSADGYWQVNVKGTTVDTDYAYVLDENNEKVQARADAGGEAKDLFDEVKREGDIFFVKLADGLEFTLPIVEGLTAIIEQPADGRWVEEDGEWKVPVDGAATKVVIKGDNFKHFITAPVGWKATVSDINQDGNAVLTIVPPIQGSSTRASADNTAEVVLQVNKGVYWAVDKIKVSVGNPQTPFERYSAGKNIVIDGVVINKATYGNAAYITTEKIGEVGIECVYFVESGATLEWRTAKPFRNGKFAIVIIGNGSDRSAVLKGITATNWVGDDVYYNSSDVGNDPLFIMKNITIENNKRFYFQNTPNPIEFIMEDCALNLNRSLFKFDGKVLKYLSIKSSTIDLRGNINMCDTPIGGEDMSLIFENNIFYSSKTDGKGELLIGSITGTTLAKTMVLKNNIFMNLNMRNNAALIQAKGTRAIECNKNIFFDFSRYSPNCAAFRLDEFPATEQAKWEDNIYYTSDAAKKLIPIYAYADNPACVFKYNFTKPETPMMSINESAGTYELNARYVAYGPQK